MKYIWLDAIDFQERGEWKLDTQFAHLMGSPYLLACHRPGVPVKNAMAVITIEKAGMYRVWVRTKNWYHPYAPGLFDIEVNNEKGAGPLGNGFSHEWYWQPSGDFLLKEGKTMIKLCDRTGYFARAAAVLLTNDMDYVPPRPVAEYVKERAKIKGISLIPREIGNFDVVVAGGGPGGVTAAIAAARQGAKTLLISGRPVLGGNGSEEAGVSFQGASSRQPNAREGGIAEEIIRHHFYHKKSYGDVMEELCCKESNLTVLYSYFVCDAETKENTISGIMARHIETGELISVHGKQFIDCTGDGWLGYYAGAKYRIGREARWEYHEEFAPQAIDTLTMSGCNMGCKEPIFMDIGEETPFVKPDWAPEFPKGDEYGRNIEKLGFVWWLEAPNQLDDLYDAELARDELFRIVIGHFHYLKNLWTEKEQVKNYVLWRMPYYDAKRESRRLIGDYVLNQNDCVKGRTFPDVVCHAGWPIDLHHPKGIYSGKEGPFFSNSHVPLVKIPFRCFYSKNIHNLLFAGRCASVSHVALGTARLQNTIMSEGQAVGTAAALCVQMELSPRKLCETKIKLLQQILLREDQYIPGMKNEDIADLAKQAIVTSSSVSKEEWYYPHIGIEEEGYELDCQRATFFARGVSQEIPSVWTKVTNHNETDVKLRFHVRQQADPDGYTTAEDVRFLTVTVPSGFSGWVELKLALRVEMRYLWIWAEQCPGVFWHIWKPSALDFTRSQRVLESEVFPNIRNETHCILLEKPDIQLANCEPENVINGYSRIQDAEQYMWASDPGQALPQFLLLQWEQPQNIRQIHLTFDSDMTNPCLMKPIVDFPPQLVKAYKIEVYDGNVWHTLILESENYLRKQIHSFPEITVEALKVTVLNSGDEKTARILEIRVYE